MRWLQTAPLGSTFLSAITIGELMHGIALLLRRDAVRAATLRAWLGSVRQEYHGRILPVTDDVATRWGELSAQRSRAIADTLIAATALVHGLAVVTRNVADFADTGVAIVNPWETA